MSLRNSCVVSLALLLAFCSAINALDITKTLSANPEFSTFNKYLTETKLAEQINGAKAVTILALDNTAISPLAGKSLDAIKETIGTHVVVGYYDEKKLMEAVGSHTQMTTLATPIFVNLVGEGSFAFASATKGATSDSELVKTVSTEPETVSILQVVKPIVDVSGAPASASASSSSSTPTNVTPVTPSVTSDRSANVAAPAPAPGPSSSSSRTQIGFFGAVIAFASVFASL